jgi:DNA-binding NtrC family response regulator
MPALGAVLIVEDSLHLRLTLETALRDSALVVHTAQSVAEARRLVLTIVPDLVLLDFDLPDGNAFDVLVNLERISPAPAIIGMSGVAGPEHAFQLAMSGVRAYLRKPLDLASLREAVHAVQSRAPILTPFVRGLVGHAPMAAVEDEVRSVMVAEALARARGSRRRAARILNVSRQALQHMLRKGRA